MNFKYPFEYPNYECMNRFVEEISSCYQKEIMPLKNQYKTELLLFNSQKYAQLLSEKAKIDLKYIKQIINFFNPILKKRRHIIFIHGSYSKKLIRWRSDIDLNILYLKKI